MERLRAIVSNDARELPRCASKREASRQYWAYTSTTASSAAGDPQEPAWQAQRCALLASYNCAMADWSPRQLPLHEPAPSFFDG